jgi:hypothetical protein
MKFKPQKMVNWYDLPQLITIGTQSIISTIFGNYADKREAQANVVSTELFYDYSSLSDCWVDYVADTGDGFDSCYSVASLLAKPSLEVDGHVLKRADILIMGGDQVYPTPQKEAYDNRLKGPYESAYQEEPGNNRPVLFAIPGNHDWYDGLTSFMKLFCQKRRIGNWQTQQQRSYFAIRLPQNVWIWGIDVQLNSDIDYPQLRYFNEVGNHMQAGDKVLLCTAEPAWVYHAHKRKDQSYARLRYFEKNLIEKRGFSLVATFAGDLHHYAHYCEQDETGDVRHKFTAGGGGAFLHPTHNLREEIKLEQQADEKEAHLSLRATFPSKEKSRWLAWKNLFFVGLNWRYCMGIAVIYLVLAWLVQSVADVGDAGPLTLMQRLKHTQTLGDALRAIGHTLQFAPAVVLICLAVIGGFTAFTDVISGKTNWLYLLGGLHGLVHVCNFFALLWLFAYINQQWLHLYVNTLLQAAVFTVEMLLGGSLVAGLVMGLYFIITNLWFRIHDNEAFSSLHYPHYKNFLRLHITAGQIRLFPVGIRKVTTQWTHTTTKDFKGEDQLQFAGKEPGVELMEEVPVTIFI